MILDKKEKMRIENIPALLYGVNSEKLYIFVHGKDSQKEEADDFAAIATQTGYQVLSFDLPKHGERKDSEYDCNIRNGINDLRKIYAFVQNKFGSYSLYANSLGVYFSLSAYQNIEFEKCLFLSPILNMERIIKNMMDRENISEDELKEKSEIETSFGETLSWNYYEFVRNNPIEKWNRKTFILYGENDNITEKSILDSFVEKNHCNLEIMKNGEHYFHTKEQLFFLKSWIQKVIKYE